MIRTITSTDISAVANIYNHYINHSIATFEEDEIDDIEMQARVEKILTASLPYLVFEKNQTILGYAYAGKWNKRSAYRFTAETSVYLREDATGQGIGKQLYKTLIANLKEKSYHSLIGGISLPNDASVVLHENLGYKKVAHYKTVGYKFNKWIDVGYWQLQLE